MLIMLARNTTGTKCDGTSDYDVELCVNEHVFAKLQVTGHVRSLSASVLLRKIADQLDREETKTRYPHADEVENSL